tara:strand:- start:1091 stop:1342 length:252 start_codon:yes stop_codon:yes gene_type:complete
MEKSYFEVVDLFNEAIDTFGWAAVTGQLDINQAADSLGKAVVNTFRQLEEEERKDALHYFGAQCLETLYCSVLNRMLDRINSA